MRKTPVVCGALICLALGAIGCDQRAAQQAQVRRDLQAAMVKLQIVQQGYVPPKVPTSLGEPPEFQAWRQSQLDQALTKLRPIISGTHGSEAQRAAANRLAADIHVAAARHASRTAAREAAALAARGSAMLSYLLAADHAVARSQLFEADPSSAIQELQTARTEHLSRRSKLQRGAADLDRRRSDELAKIDHQKRKANAEIAKAGSLRHRAFVVPGARKYRLYDEAAVAERRAQLANAEADKHRVTLNTLDRDLAVTRDQLTLANRLLDELDQRLEDTKLQQKEIAASIQQAEADRDQAVSELVTKFEELLREFDQKVDQPLAAAAQRLDEVIKNLGSLRTPSDRAQQSSIQTDLIAALTTKADLKTVHVMALSEVARFLEVATAVSEELSLYSRDRFESRLIKLRDRQKQLVEQAEVAIQKGIDLAEEDSAYPQQLKTYRQRLNQVALH